MIAHEPARLGASLRSTKVEEEYISHRLELGGKTMHLGRILGPKSWHRLKRSVNGVRS